MKFYVISTILTVLVLLIPIKQAIVEAHENTVSVSIQNNQNSGGNGGGNGIEEDNSGNNGGSGGGSENTDNTNQYSKNNIINSQTKENKTNITKKNGDKAIPATNSVNNDIVSSSGNSENSGSSNYGSTGSGNGNGGGGANGTGSGNGNRSGSGIGNGNGAGNGNGGGKGSGGAKSYGCQKGKGYKMVYNPKIKLNKAQSLRIKRGTSIKVTASFTSDGSLQNIRVGSGDPEVQNLAKNAASKIKVNIIDKTITKCDVVVVYSLESDS